MTRKVFILMAITLAAATAATAATAFAQEELPMKKRNTGQEVSTVVNTHADAVRQTKVRNLPQLPDNDVYSTAIARKPLVLKRR